MTAKSTPGAPPAAVHVVLVHANRGDEKVPVAKFAHLTHRWAAETGVVSVNSSTYRVEILLDSADGVATGALTRNVTSDLEFAGLTPHLDTCGLVGGSDQTWPVMFATAHNAERLGLTAGRVTCDAPLVAAVPSRAGERIDAYRKAPRRKEVAPR